MVGRRAPILHLHSLAQGGASGDAGQWKNRGNEIVVIVLSGERRVRFKATPAKETPAIIRSLCEHYREVIEAGRVPPLLVGETFAFDFLCIHPFHDGNGRVSVRKVLAQMKKADRVRLAGRGRGARREIVRSR